MESRCLVIMSSTKLEIRNFYVVVEHRRQRSLQKCVMHVQNCCFVYLNLLLFWRSRCRCLRRLSLLKLAAHSVSWRPYHLRAWPIGEVPCFAINLSWLCWPRYFKLQQWNFELLKQLIHTLNTFPTIFFFLHWEFIVSYYTEKKSDSSL